MKDYQREFLKFVISSDALRFGEFSLKSGRISPYFFNAGQFKSGESINRLASFYARTLADSIAEDFMLFGPAYKGIPLATATAMTMARDFNRDIPFAYDRKEPKDHGEGGALVGSPLEGPVIIIDDVITAGLSVDHSVRLIRESGARPAGVVIALDRQERARDSSSSAVQDVENRHGIPVYPIVTMETMIEYLKQTTEKHQVDLDPLVCYREQYGAQTKPKQV